MRFLTGFAAGAILSSSVVYASMIHVQRQRLRQSILLREQALILDSVHDEAVVVPENAPIGVLRTMLRRKDPYEEYKRWWNAKVEDFGDWLNGGGVERGLVKGVALGKEGAKRVGEWISSEKRA